MEDDIREYFCKSKVLETAGGKKEAMIEKIANDVDVLEEWSFVSIHITCSIPQPIQFHVAEQLSATFTMFLLGLQRKCRNNQFHERLSVMFWNRSKEGRHCAVTRNCLLPVTDIIMHLMF